MLAAVMTMLVGSGLVVAGTAIRREMDRMGAHGTAI